MTRTAPLLLIHAGLAACLFVAACAPAPVAETPLDAPTPPIARVEPHRLEAHGTVRTDDYYWLRERENPEVVAYLEAENDYLSEVMKPTEPLQQLLFEEIVGRIKQDDDTVPYRKGDYFYYRRYVEGGEYPIHCRKKGSLEAEEEILLDGNELAAGHDFLSIRGIRVTTDGRWLAYATDTVGRRFYDVSFKNLETGEVLPYRLENVTSNQTWANDDATLFYSKQDPETLRSHRIYSHVLGTDPASDRLVFDEVDETFGTYVYKTRSDAYVMIVSYQSLATEIRYLEAGNPEGEFQVLEPRRRGHEYSVDHDGGQFFIRTNHEAENFRLVKTSVTATGLENWQEVIAHRPDVFLQSFELFRDHLVVGERIEGLRQLRIVPLDGSEEHYLDFGEAAFFAFPSDNFEFDTPVLRYRYSSLTTPWSTFDYDMSTREKTLVKQDEVVGGWDPESFVTERLSVEGRDGARVPVSIVRSREAPLDGEAPLLLSAYGAYGETIDPTFDSARLSLLERGFSFAIAHVRGSQTLGRQWYEDGKLLHKKNTFADFVDVAEYLVSEGYTASDRLFAEGASAGGLLMGVVANERPDLFAGIVAVVPWVDVVTTMSDPDIPLTTAEFDEWGDPSDEVAYDYMLSYSPYDNVTAKDYPHLLVTTGFQDPQVPYWEPAKWVAKLRATKTDSNRLLLSTDMDAGHQGASGRFERHRGTALQYAFLLDLAGIGQ